ncbi:hypothetical protein KZ483_07535 [Paenibacillus sp. sptzw28]|nr:hypothetical protein [Paenibacillus sp. sptzw28]QYR22785.1 hypothetical protein KZ483_07535 [Paenibacillus sp. sptzw28]
MPRDKIVAETDGDPKTEYEDKTAHERAGFVIDDSQKSEEHPEKSQGPLS